MESSVSQVVPQQADWESLIPAAQWARYKCVLDRLLGHGVPFALGGGLAVGVYTGRLRYTKDLDIYILPESRKTLVKLMDGCGMVDYFDTLPYDRKWIYRGTAEVGEERVIVDAIWSMANQRALVDREWLSEGPMIRMFLDEFRVIPAEELIWSKLYVLQRDRCDWPDILNLIHAVGPKLNWDRLFRRAAEDQPLLKSLLSLFSWVDAEKAALIPLHVWNHLGLPLPEPAADPIGRPSRPDLLDSRPWFGDPVAEGVEEHPC